ncbi:right-handed parallel beta-helix repeat-containing protein [Rugosimonospora africana]|uniref:Right handed beta helix domain-containing protein n=1 Tax=Rugosimonospora africana TaxID=556532 RepID=A0A8J3VRA9_9ACTN|nr:right-handed parallel beta-helix repeat-containing protein [Rugosimonospora africana]GIH15223.1 hypothetical protein Raf01_33950 [Rugosimonospora africana]
MKKIFSIVAVAVVALGVTSFARPASAAGVQTIYMNANGSDTNDGATTTTAVKTLTRVQQLVAAGPLDEDVEVRIHAGTYVAAGITWTTYRPGYTISFMPDDYQYGEGLPGIAARPVFVNARASGSNRYIGDPWFMACAGNAGQPLNAGGTSGLGFYYLTVEMFAPSAISLDGSAGPCGGAYHASSGLGLPSARGLNGNTIFGMLITDIGNAYTGGSCTDENWLRCGYGGIVLTESSNNRIANNSFVDLRNSENSYIHALYMTHKSSHNTFSANSITGVSSDPVKVRDASDYNTFDSNTFGANDFVRSSTQGAHYREEVGDGDCSSYHNRFTNNDLGTWLIGSSANLPTWVLDPAGATWPGSAGCPALPAGETRLTTAGNTY